MENEAPVINEAPEANELSTMWSFESPQQMIGSSKNFPDNFPSIEQSQRGNDDNRGKSDDNSLTNNRDFNGIDHDIQLDSGRKHYRKQPFRDTLRMIEPSKKGLNYPVSPTIEQKRESASFSSEESSVLAA